MRVNTDRNPREIYNRIPKVINSYMANVVNIWLITAITPVTSENNIN